MTRLGKFSIALAALVSSVAHAQEGQWNAADQYYDAQEMTAAKKYIQWESGGQNFYMVRGERLEYQSNEGEPLLFWDMEGWYGGDIHKLWVKTEGAYHFDDNTFEEAEVEVLYNRTISPFFDLQMGLRHDFKPHPSTTYGVIGVHGLAPHWIEVDLAAFISDDGDVTIRLEAEYDLMLTQRLIMQPRAEIEIALQDVPVLGLGSGISDVEAGLRLRYEIKREFAPYVGVSWHRKLGETADFARTAGEKVDSLSFVAGIRFWF